MKKKIALLLTVSVLTIGCLTGCNKQVFDTTYEFNYAVIQMPNGEIIEGKVESWKDYAGEQLQVVIDGVTYLTSSYNCTLIYDPNK